MREYTVKKILKRSKKYKEIKSISLEEVNNKAYTNLKKNLNQ